MMVVQEKEIAIAEEKWAHEVVEELEEEERVEEGFEECIHPHSPVK